MEHSAVAREACLHTPNYCEENVWHLCKQLVAQADGAAVYAVFISNEAKQAPMWHQGAGDAESGMVVWDYHVVALTSGPRGDWVYDLDTTLPFPCPAQQYIQQAFRTDARILPKFQQKLRVVSAAHLLERFASDRSHMRAEDGSWSSPPPSTPLIAVPGCAHNLERWIDMEHGDAGFGLVCDPEGLLRMLDGELLK